MSAEARQMWGEADVIISAQRDRNDKIERHLRLLALEDENEKTGLVSVVSNDPAALFWLAVAILSDRAPIDRVHIGDQGEAAETQSGKAERGLSGFWLQRDRDALADGGDLWNREVAFWMCMGSYYTFYWLDKQPDGTPKPIADVLSPLETYDRPGMDGYGMQALCHEYRVTAGEARDHAIAIGGTPSAVVSQYPHNEVVVRDYWYRRATDDPTKPWVVYYSVMVTSGWGCEYILNPTEMDSPRIPVLGGPVAGRPRRGFSSQTTLQAGQGILDQNEPIYSFVNKILTGYARIARLYQRAPWLATGIGLNVGEDDINTNEDYDIEGKLIQTTNPQANLRRVDPGRSPIEIRDLFQVTDGLLERGGLSRALFGVLDASPSGFAISRILTSASHKLTPYVIRMNYAREVIGQAWLEWYRDGYATGSGKVAYAPYLVQAVNKGMSSGQAEEFQPRDVPRRFFVRSEQPLALPSDVAEKVNVARMARPQGPVMSQRTVQETLLSGIVEDPALDRQWMVDEAVREDPLVAAINRLARMMVAKQEWEKQGKKEAADLMQLAIDLLRDNLHTQLGPAASPGGSRSVGMPNNVMPSEMQRAGMSEDIVRSMTGRSMGNNQGGAPNAR